MSLPLQWTEVRATLIPGDFNMGDCATWRHRADPWSDFFQDRQSLNAAARLLTRL